VFEVREGSGNREQGEHRAGGVRLENMVVVTKDGAEIIDHTPCDHILESEVSHLWSV
jgi:hypothetical protein